MVTEAVIEKYINDIFKNINFHQETSGLLEAVSYMVNMGGKKIRPRLCLTVYSMFKEKFDDSILEPAAGLEIFHCFTLLHDDIMDKSPLRRGVPTVWKKWGENIAILAGDVMCIDSYRRISKAPAKKLEAVLDIFTTTAAKVCDGQQYDMDYESLPSIPMYKYSRMIGLKTAVLLACAAKIGAIIGGADEQEANYLYDYGFDLGQAFQITDDFLDVYGEENVFGKPIGGDIVNNKKSWLTTRAFEKVCAMSEIEKRLLADKYNMEISVTRLNEITRRATHSREEELAKIAEVKAVYEMLGVPEDAKAEILRLTDEAMHYAEELNFKPEKFELLKNFADKLISRNK